MDTSIILLIVALALAWLYFRFLMRYLTSYGGSPSQKKSRKNHAKKDISIAYPTLFSKRFASVLLVQIYSEEFELTVKKRKIDLIGKDSREVRSHIELQKEKTVTVKLSSTDIDFSEPVTKSLKNPVTEYIFLAKPSEKCYPDKHETLSEIAIR